MHPITKAKMPVVDLGVGKLMPTDGLGKPFSTPIDTVSKPLLPSKIPIPASTTKQPTSTAPRDYKSPKSISKKPKLANLGAVAQTDPIVARLPVVYQHELLVVDDPRPRVKDMDIDTELLKLQMDMIPSPLKVRFCAPLVLLNLVLGMPNLTLGMLPLETFGIPLQRPQPSYTNFYSLN